MQIQLDEAGWVGGKIGSTVGFAIGATGVAGLVKTAYKGITYAGSTLLKIGTQRVVSRTPAKGFLKFAECPLENCSYSKKVLEQMKPRLETGLPDFHGFPLLVDKYAKFGKIAKITGKDGIQRTKISLKGGYKKRSGFFEWIIEPNNIINHRLFVSE